MGNNIISGGIYSVKSSDANFKILSQKYQPSGIFVESLRATLYRYQYTLPIPCSVQNCRFANFII